jgi:AcrR family transcriptional regulator
MPKSAKIQRRKPKQRRSRFTCEVIFSAVTQILETKGEAALTTNAIAERAGVSVGSLYQYFLNKEAILIEMAREETARFAETVGELAIKTSDPDHATRAAIRSHIRAFEGLPATRRAAVKAMIDAESASAIGRRTDQTAYRLPAPATASRIDAFVLTRAVTSIIRAAVLEGFSGLNEPAFEEALIRLVTGFRAAATPAA